MARAPPRGLRDSSRLSQGPRSVARPIGIALITGQAPPQEPGDASPTGIERRGLGLRHVVALIVMAQLADLVTTVHALAAGNAEQNPLNRWVLRWHGAIGLLGMKGIAALVIVAALARIPAGWARGAGLVSVAVTTMAALSNTRFA